VPYRDFVATETQLPTSIEEHTMDAKKDCCGNSSNIEERQAYERKLKMIAKNTAAAGDGCRRAEELKRRR
jgi:hypothetical protein